jgi:hypothetical protein
MVTTLIKDKAMKLKSCIDRRKTTANKGIAASGAGRGSIGFSLLSAAVSAGRIKPGF